ncbi:Trp biosynthesis-associated membrane protein [Catenuloplanes japonicus]|uniref:Trp biosynthesis-associated membrane protein n=1 Tax=Catenuloplanes japonicus TaxID=33876 RepID=UPI0005273F0A|nr:Trp biosynthesis-associated membrane protein [Catenuloplanes japonicus]
MSTAAHRRAFTIALVLCVAGAGLALYAVTRVWLVEVTTRAAPLPPVRAERTGGDLLSWLPPLAVVSLAGAGAVIATRGLVRRLVGALLAVLGLAIVAGAAANLSVGVWPVLTLIGGLAVLAAGGWTAARGPDWPSMGARYERPARAAQEPQPAMNGPRGTRQAWDALDRGEDPTGE